MNADADKSEEIDDDVIEIFLDEAGELLEEIDETIHHWEADWSDTDKNSALQRSLHTLKGGARLAGFKLLGDLAHSFETYLIDNKNNTSANNFSVDIETFQDKLHHAVDLLTP